jgi:hypothetical protein
MPFRDLEEFTVREPPLAAPAASERLGLAERGRDDVLATTLGGPVHPVRAFADLFTTEDDLVNRGCIMLAGNEPDLRDRVEANLVRMLGKERGRALYSGGGFLRRTR